MTRGEEASGLRMIWMITLMIDDRFFAWRFDVYRVSWYIKGVEYHSYFELLQLLRSHKFTSAQREDKDEARTRS